MLEAERESSRELRRIVAALTARIPEIEAPQTAQEASHNPAEPEEGARGPRPERWRG